MKISAIQLTGQYPARQRILQSNATVQNSASLGADTFVSFGAQRVYPKEAPAMVCLEKVKSRGGIVPKRVEDLAKEYAKDEILKDLTLTEVHKIAYADLKKCKTLDEAKKLFPEFKCVECLDTLPAKEGSVIYGLQIGDVEVYGLNYTHLQIPQCLRTIKAVIFTQHGVCKSRLQNSKFRF